MLSREATSIRLFFPRTITQDWLMPKTSNLAWRIEGKKSYSITNDCGCHGYVVTSSQSAKI